MLRPYAAYAPFIIQLYNDHVTGGCGLNTFCPGDPIGEWETLVWLAKGGPPNGSGTIPFWPTYHPVPRGSTYTLRDEGNRVVTEIAGGLSGSGTASLAVARDNVYLGGLLVASSAGAWSYSASDHLGSIRAVWNASGTKTEDHRYWPYGEDAMATLNQHLSFQGMERNDATHQYYDHARSQQFNIGRFLSTDPYHGSIEEPATWNRYCFALGNPIRYTDPDGLNSDDEPNDDLPKSACLANPQACGAEASIEEFVNVSGTGPTGVEIIQQGTEAAAPVVFPLFNGTMFFASTATGNMEITAGLRLFRSVGSAWNAFRTARPALPFKRDLATKVQEAIDRALSRSPRFSKDGTTFRNDQGLLPQRGTGYYSEWTVEPAPGSPGRGTERLVVGSDGDIYYTHNHYGSFVRIK